MEYKGGTLILVAVICTSALGQSALAAPQDGRGAAVVLADDIPVAHTLTLGPPAATAASRPPRPVAGLAMPECRF